METKTWFSIVPELYTFSANLDVVNRICCCFLNGSSKLVTISAARENIRTKQKSGKVRVFTFELAKNALVFKVMYCKFIVPELSLLFLDILRKACLPSLEIVTH